MGRFISRDTYEGSLTEAPSLHRFAYAWMNPLRYWDFNGHQVAAPELVPETLESELPPVEFSDQKVYEAEQNKAAADEQERAKGRDAARAQLAECRARGECQKDTFVAGESDDAPGAKQENDDPGVREAMHRYDAGFARVRAYAKTGQEVTEAAMTTLPGLGQFYDLKLTVDEARNGNWRPALIRAGIALVPGAVVAVAKVGGKWVAKVVKAEAGEAKLARRGDAIERAALDANALILGLEKGELQAVDHALSGRAPVLSITAAKEFLRKGDVQVLREFLAARGGGIGAAATAEQIAELQAQAQVLGRVLKAKDAAVVGSAAREGVPLVTRDERLLKFMQAAGLPVESF
jgi:hypothetical protein